MIGLGLSDMADLRAGNVIARSLASPPPSARRFRHQYPFVFETHETTIHVAAVPVLIGYVRVSKADGSQVLD
jgi:hypothetical protein